MRSRAESLILNPYSVLVMMAYFILAIGLLHALADAIAWGDNADEVFEGLTNDLWVMVGAVALTVAMISVVHGVKARRSGDYSGVPDDIGQRLLNPVWLTSIAPYAFLVFGLIKTLYFLVDEGDSEFQYVMTWTFNYLFHTSAGVFFIFALKAISDWLHTDPTAGESVQSTAEKATDNGTQDTQGQNSDSATETAGSDTETNTSGLKAVLDNPDRLLTLGIYLTAYLGVLAVVFVMWWWADQPAGRIWSQFFEHAAMVGGAIAFLLLARTVVNWITGTKATDDQLVRGENEPVSAWIQRLTVSPRRMVDLATAVVIATGLPFFLIDIWSSRNDEVEEFWSKLLENSLYGVIGLGTLLVLRAAILLVLAGPRESIVDRFRAAMGGPLLSDPSQLLRYIVYALAFIGLLNVSVTSWDQRGRDVWIVWYYFFNSFLVMALPLAMALGGRALYAEIDSDVE